MSGYEVIADEDVGGEGATPLLTDTGVFELGVDVVLPCSVAVEQAMSELVR